MASDKKAQAIYDAVHSRLMDLRVRLMRSPWVSNELDTLVAKAMDEAAINAVEAYRKPLSAPKGGA